jgi:cysteine desulfurase/selenocysteine lyase
MNSSKPIDSVISRFRQPKEEISIYLNTAAESLFYQPHGKAFEKYAFYKSAGSEGRSGLTKVESETRAMASTLIGVPEQDVVFLSSTSRCLDAAIKSIKWEPGDNVVFSETEFLTTEFTGALLQQLGIELRLVPSVRGIVALDEYASRIDSRTRLTIASSVSYKTGLILDIDGLGKVVKENGGLLFVDGIQGLGSVATKASAADFFAAGTFKWLFGAHGVAIFYVNPKIIDQLKTPYVGYHSVSQMFREDRTSNFDLWPDARRFQEGLPNYPGICVLQSSLMAIEEAGLTEIFLKNKSLMTTLMKGLIDLGIEPFGYDALDQHAPIVAFESREFESIGRELMDLGIVVWAKDGRVRLSPHFYNDESDIVAALDALKRIIKR